MSIGRDLVKMSDRFYDRMRDPQALIAARAGAGAHGFDALRGHKYCLLVTFRRSGEPVPTPVWFGLDDRGEALYVRTGADAGKVKRIRANPRVLVGPASARGKPTAALAEGRGRVLAAEEQPQAERVLQSNYGLGRRLYEGMAGPLGVDSVYLEVTSSDVA
jgi:uncharacterized protein